MTRSSSISRCSSGLFARSTSSCPLSSNCHSRLSGAKRSEEHTSELQSLMRISYAVFCLKKKKQKTHMKTKIHYQTHNLSPYLQNTPLESTISQTLAQS